VAAGGGGGVGLRQGLLAGLACAALLALLHALGAFELIDLRLHDWRYRLRGPVPASDRITLVEVDDATVDAYHAWPLPRSTYALLVDALRQGGAQASAFDLLFLGDSPDDPAGDRLLAGITAGQDNLVHAITFLPEDPALGSGASSAAETRAELVRHGRPVARQRLASARRASLPYDALLEAADALGHTVVAVDRDGVVRRIPEFVRYGDWAYPSLAIRLVESAARRDTTLPQFELAEDGLRLHWQGRQVRVPVDAEGATSIVYAGDRGAFPHTYSMLRVLQWYRSRDTTALARAFRGKLVLVGVTAVGEVAADVGPTPFAEATPLVFIHANSVNAALRAHFMARPGRGEVVIVLLALGLLLGATLSALPLGRSAAVAGGAIVMLAGLDMLAFLSGGWDLPPTAALLLPPCVWIGVQGLHRRRTELDARARAKELEVARSIQRHLLPAGPPAAPALDVHGVNVPAEAVGGDYYDWLAVGDDEIAIVVGDVSGHGVPAALLMAHVRASLHAEARPERKPSEIVQSIHASLSRAAFPGKFATFFLALVSTREPRLRYCNAGHNPPILLREGGEELLGATGLPLAMLEFGTYADEERRFGPGDTLVLYSDGVPEAPVRAEFYGDERLRQKVGEFARAPDASAQGIVASLLADVRALSGAALAADDVTIVVVRRLPVAPPGA